MVPTYGLTHVVLSVRDLARSARFYQQLVGARVVYSDANFVQLQTPGSRDVIVLERRPAAGREARRHRALRVPPAPAGRYRESRRRGESRRRPRQEHR